ncbi:MULTISPECIES: hypothetical protein [Halomonadaceae]|uniref:Uncharacterized protein n=1 Tax=Vreelandella piezotolerans TaxID=2609667 RepID=A0ABQ6X4I4_9GAMM|nr:MULTISPECIES: hypothetical protein [Halomonas]KFC50536.1 hypothetical protein DK37_19055 [Halomonas sp. SUBG004]KAE8436939.1 hypothetical protein F1978_17305 [Halomonas piezotolerans]MCG7578368.1 hypothetical protein [Halomonas sp. MMH1-48]MCG7605480.1 hypothetical protein [Halomonas sp. MM17-34]MCG7614628.1 hypothetical protein [Halomonas sp. MM17-29]
MKHSPPSFYTTTALFDLWKASMMGMELWSSSLSTIARRQQLWQTQPFFSPSMMRENQRMVTEKMEASMEAGLVVQKALLNAMSGRYAPWWITSQKAMQPYHRRSSANSRRLSR